MILLNEALNMFAKTLSGWTLTTFPLFFKSKKESCFARDKFTHSFLTYWPEDKFVLLSAFAMSSTHKGHSAFIKSFQKSLRKRQGGNMLHAFQFWIAILHTWAHSHCLLPRCTPGCVEDTPAETCSSSVRNNTWGSLPGCQVSGPLQTASTTGWTSC